MQRLGAAVSLDTRVHLVGGASAVLLGWRDTTIDIDLAVVPESDEVFRAIARLKEEFNVNIEFASGAVHPSVARMGDPKPFYSPIHPARFSTSTSMRIATPTYHSR